jgi:hypothetical protein
MVDNEKRNYYILIKFGVYILIDLSLRLNHLNMKIVFEPQVHLSEDEIFEISDLINFISPHISKINVLNPLINNERVYSIKKRNEIVQVLRDTEKNIIEKEKWAQMEELSASEEGLGLIMDLKGFFKTLIVNYNQQTKAIHEIIAILMVEEQTELNE